MLHSYRAAYPRTYAEVKRLAKVAVAEAKGVEHDETVGEVVHGSTMAEQGDVQVHKKGMKRATSTGDATAQDCTKQEEAESKGMEHDETSGNAMAEQRNERTATSPVGEMSAPGLNHASGEQDTNADVVATPLQPGTSHSGGGRK